VRGKLVGDLHDFLGGQIPREKRERWEVVVLGDTFGLTGPQELHDRGDQRRKRHDVVSATVIRRPRCRERASTTSSLPDLRPWRNGKPRAGLGAHPDHLFQRVAVHIFGLLGSSIRNSADCAASAS
jgi:hypothetical protein